jgi:ParB family transcriptional regulator, chromosome partitioning protein
MAKNSKDAYGAVGESKVLHFDPGDLLVVDDPKHPLYDERVDLPLSAELVANILHHGRVLEPVIVRKNPETGKLEVVAGRQRVRAVREIQKRGDVLKALPERLQSRRGKDAWRVPALIDRARDDDLAEVMISENEIRLSDSPMVRAEKMRRLLGRGKTELELQVLFGCSTQTVKNTLGLLDATATVRKAVDSGRISTHAAYRLAKLEPDEQKERVAALLAEAPSAPGKKNKKARRAREIVDGKPALRTEKDIKALRDELATTETIRENYRHAALATLDWVMGLDTINQFYDRQEPEEEEDEMGEAAEG